MFLSIERLEIPIPEANSWMVISGFAFTNSNIISDVLSDALSDVYTDGGKSVYQEWSMFCAYVEGAGYLHTNHALLS